MIPTDMALDSLLIAETVPDRLDLAAFDKLHTTHEAYELEWLNRWVASQGTCDGIMRHHGQQGLGRVLTGIAKASSVHKVHMCDRVASIAQFHGFAVY